MWTSNSFDRKYLGHNLIPHENGLYTHIFICNKCNIFVSYGYQYRYANNNYMPFIKLNLTCDEMVIKGLLE